MHICDHHRLSAGRSGISVTCIGVLSVSAFVIIGAVSLSIALLPSLVHAAEPLTESQAISRVELLKGKITRDTNVPDHPVIGIEFQSSIKGEGGSDNAYQEPATTAPEIVQHGPMEDTYSSRFGDRFFHLLKAFPHLKRLCLSKTAVTDVGLMGLPMLQELEYLDVSFTRITDNGLKQIAALTRLTTLNLTNLTITDAGLKELRDLGQLRTLDLRGTKITNDGLKVLGDLKHLAILNLYHTTITDAGLKELGALTDLTELYLARTKITGAGFNDLRGLTKLTLLDLSMTDLSDPGVTELREIKSLKSLNLSYARLSEPSLQQLRVSLPGTRIIRHAKRITE